MFPSRQRGDRSRAVSVLEDVAKRIGAQGVTFDDRVAKVSIVGVGMRSHSGVAARMFGVLAKEGVNIQMISTSEIAVSCVIEDKYTELAVRALHEAFELGKERAQPDFTRGTRASQAAWYTRDVMGTFSVEVHVRPAGASEKPPAPVKCLVDTGAAFCQFPTPLLASLGISPDRQVPVVLADGTRRNQPAAWVEIRYGDLTAFTLVLFGGDNGLTLLGAHALEGLGLSVDPVRKTLEPSRFPLA